MTERLYLPTRGKFSTQPNSTKIGIWIRVADVINPTKFGNDRSKEYKVTEGRMLPCSIGMICHLHCSTTVTWCGGCCYSKQVMTKVWRRAWSTARLQWMHWWCIWVIVKASLLSTMRDGRRTLTQAESSEHSGSSSSAMLDRLVTSSSSSSSSSSSLLTFGYNAS